MKHSDKEPQVRIKTDYARHETDKLVSDIDKAIEKSKSVQLTDIEYKLEAL